MEARLIQEWIAIELKEDKEDKIPTTILYWFRSTISYMQSQ